MESEATNNSNVKFWKCQLPNQCCHTSQVPFSNRIIQGTAGAAVPKLRPFTGSGPAISSQWSGHRRLKINPSPLPRRGALSPLCLLSPMKKSWNSVGISDSYRHGLFGWLPCFPHHASTHPLRPWISLRVESSSTDCDTRNRNRME
ncbi:hypothetical protein Zmor_027851 [Zophobas morio]|uniref:Uncharacterized protein n=1 Tax=Zophobas morio TaxID=2755281 RepID=A0AA38HUC7_9CUCU|nr:hypothetical protein Zmor_027851 [Zophobas morio]